MTRDVDQDAERMYRLGRMRDVALVRGKTKDADYEVPEGFALSDHAGRAAWEIGEDPDGPVEADVWLAFPRSLWAERNEHGTLVEDRDDGSQLRRFRVLRRDPFLRWVLSLAGDARVEVARADGFERPTRLTPEETLCLALALRGSTASTHVTAPVARERLLDRAEGYLAHRDAAANTSARDVSSHRYVSGSRHRPKCPSDDVAR